MINKNKIDLLFLAPANSIHSHKWINYFSRKKDFNIHWISINKKILPIERKINFIYLKKPKSIFDWINLYIRLKIHLKKINPDLVHIHSIGTYGILGLICNVPNKICTVWGSDLMLNMKNYFKFIFVKKILKQSKLITTDAHHIRDLIIKLGIKKNNVKIINFGIDTSKFKKFKIDKLKIKDNLINQRNINIVSTRNFYDVYKIEVLIKAIKLLIEKNSNIRLYLIGNGPKSNELKKLVIEYNLEKFITFLGSIENKKLPRILNAMNIYVSSSISDAGIASSTAEAMSCECLCIISNVFDNKEWIIEGKNGFLFEANNSSDLSKKILKALEYLKLKKFELQKNARKIILTNNSYKNEMLKMEKIIQDLLKS